MLTKPKATIEDYKKLPEGAKYELIDGEIIERENPGMPGPKIKHQEISATIIRIAGNAIIEKKHGVIFHAPTDVYFDEENAFQPDIFLSVVTV